MKSLNSVGLRVACACAVLPLFVVGLSGQRPKETLRQMVLEHRTDVSLSINEDGPIVTFDQMVGATELCIRATLGEPTVHLTADETWIYTEYELLDPTVIFVEAAASTDLIGPGKTLRLTLQGGTVVISGTGLMATVFYQDAPAVRAGMDVMLFLRRRNGQLGPAMNHGIFEVRDGVLVPVIRDTDEHLNVAGVQVGNVVERALATKVAAGLK